MKKPQRSSHILGPTPRGSGPVGYGRPPVHSRFKPGQSGNPRGRTRGRGLTKEADIRRLVGELLWKVGKEKLAVREGDRSLTVSKIEAVIRGLYVKAMKADARTATTLLELLKEYREFAPGAETVTGITFRFVRPDGSEEDIVG